MSGPTFDLTPFLVPMTTVHPDAGKPKVLFKVRNFSYNGFFGQVNEGFAPYTVTSFVEWTPDPGIGKFLCSDGVERLLPTFALDGDAELPKKPEKTGVIFGTPCKS